VIEERKKIYVKEKISIAIREMDIVTVNRFVMMSVEFL